MPSLSRVAVKTRQVHRTVLKSTLAVLMHLYSVTCKRSTYRLHEDCCTLVVSLTRIKGKIFLIVHRTLGGRHSEDCGINNLVVMTLICIYDCHCFVLQIKSVCVVQKSNFTLSSNCKDCILSFKVSLNFSQMKRGRNQRKHVMRHQEFLLG